MMKTSLALLFFVPGTLASAASYAWGLSLWDVFEIGVFCGLVCVTLFGFTFTPQAARGDFLEDLGKNFAIAREYYGDSEDKPNDHCYYRKDATHIWGWYENDDTLRDRIAERVRRTP